MMNFLFSRKKTANSEKIKLNHLKQHCRQAIKMLLILHKQHNIERCTLVIGQPEAGKSTLCASSGTLLYSTQENKALNESAFEIYQLHRTLLLHIPQGFFLFNEARQQHCAWHFLASQLKQQRPYLLISHCFIIIDLHDLLTRSNASNNTRLSQVALALNTLIHKFKRSLDTSVFLTKTDLIPGFSEFFDRENKEFLQQPWGICLTDVDADSLNAEYEQLIKKLNERLLWRLHHEVNSEYLHLIKAFPLVMETVKQKLASTLPGFLTQWHRCTKNLPLYFVSCRQFKELNEETRSENMPSNNNLKCGHTYFFTQQALEAPCQTLALPPTLSVEKLTRIIFIALVSLIFLAFIFYTSEKFSKQLNLIQASHQAINSGKVFIKKPYSSLSLSDVTNELEEISHSLEILNENQRSLLLEKFIFTRDSKLESQLQSLYQRIISQQWLPVINQRLESYLQSHLSNQPENAYIAFKIYLMLSQPDELIDTGYINAHLPDLLNSPSERINLLPVNIQKNIVVFDQSSPFIQNCRDSFLALPASKLAYILLFSNLDTHHPLDISSALGKKQASLEIDKNFSTISKIYTEKSFSTIYEKRLLAIANETANGNSVLGKRHSKNISADSLLPQLQEEYIQLYSSTWEDAIKHIHLRKTNTLKDFSTQITLLTSIDSPILSLLKLSQTNTSFPEIEQASTFLKDFNETLTAKSTPENSALFHSFVYLKNLNEQLLKAQNGGDLKMATCALLQQEYAATEQNPSNAQQIRYLATQLPEPIKTWWLDLIDTYYTFLNKNSAECQ